MPDQGLGAANGSRVIVGLSEAVQPLQGAVEGLHISTSTSYELCEAIERTAALLQDCPRASVYARLAAHLDNLLAEQLRQVSVQPLPVID
tara:strand:+ start:11355 stop:11624 length:270 start_codon:yes stop_codon:yes gene_type:complete